MKLKEIYQLGIKLAIEADPRGKKVIEADLKRLRDAYQKMEEREKLSFDEDSLTNPFADSRILNGDPNKEIKTIMVGIDMETPELLLAHELNKSGEKIDLVLAHHPEGRALLQLGEVMDVQYDVMTDVGVPINVAQKILAPRIAEIARSIHPLNFQRMIDAARFLGLTYACFHTITDNLVYRYLRDGLCKKKFRTVGDVLDELYKIPEYQMAAKGGNPPDIVVGDKKSMAGRIAPLEMTGGTNGPEDMYAKLSAAGVGTILSMHATDKHRKEAEKNHLNIIVCGHQASDSIGINLFLDRLEKKGVKILPVGMIRYNRIKKR
ncbi:NGG1p interacting factor NIF3 [Candidatus Peregrinibacteria bacterium]|nr:NGG1p interacting factor NIF3 [Candidatus Peregrinibacteria bacterium]